MPCRNCYSQCKPKPATNAFPSGCLDRLTASRRRKSRRQNRRLWLAVKRLIRNGIEIFRSQYRRDSEWRTILIRGEVSPQKKNRNNSTVVPVFYRHKGEIVDDCDHHPGLFGPNSQPTVEGLDFCDRNDQILFVFLREGDFAFSFTILNG